MIDPIEAINTTSSEEKMSLVMKDNETENHIPDWIKDTSLGSNEEINIESLVK